MEAACPNHGTQAHQEGFWALHHCLSNHVQPGPLAGPRRWQKLGGNFALLRKRTWTLLSVVTTNTRRIQAPLTTSSWHLLCLLCPYSECNCFNNSTPRLLKPKPCFVCFTVPHIAFNFWIRNQLVACPLWHFYLTTCQWKKPDMQVAKVCSFSFLLLPCYSTPHVIELLHLVFLLCSQVHT